MNLRDDLYEQCSDHSALSTSSSKLLGSRPKLFLRYLASLLLMTDMITDDLGSYFRKRLARSDSKIREPLDCIISWLFRNPVALSG